jgi:hypothetical protein
LAKFSNATHLHITEVQVAGGVATYFYDTLQGVRAVAGEQVIVTGFADARNNVTTILQTMSAAVPGFITVGTTTQVDEVHAASAAITYATGCKASPKPSKWQAVSMGKNPAGCNYHAKSPKPKTGSKSLIGSFNGQVLPNILTFNQRTFAMINHYWKDPGPPAGKAAWEAQAAACPVMNYKGIIKTLTGKQYWNLANKYANEAWFAGDTPHGAETFRAVFSTPASDWIPPTPNITGTVLYASGRLYIQTPWDDNFNQCIMQPEVSSPPGSPIPQAARSHVMSSELELYYIGEFDPPFEGFYGPCAIWVMDINYPFFPNGLKGPITFGVRIFDFNRWTFSNYVWLRASP